MANKALLEQRQDIQNGYEAKIYSMQEAQQKITDIELQIERLTRQHDRETQHTAHRQTLNTLTTQPPSQLQAWIMQDDPTIVNHLLTALCETIVITPMYELKVVWR